MSCSLFSCAHGQKLPPLDAQHLLDRAREAHKVPVTMTADAKAFVDAPQNGGRYAMRIAVKRPGALRLEANTPLGDPAAILVTDEGRFALLDLRQNTFYKGPATPENLSRLLPAPLTAEELAALFTGSFPELPNAEIEAKGSTLIFKTQDARDEVDFGDDLRVDEVRRYNAQGLAWRVHLDEHDDSSGAQVPRLFHLSVPSQKTEVDLRLKDIDAGHPPPAGAFLLGVPKGMQVEEVP